MILFREKYRAVFDNIKADYGQIDKIFDEEKNAHQKTKNQIIPFRYAGTLAAAVAIVAVLAVYPGFSGFLGTQETEYDPVGVVGYNLEKSWDNTEITSGSSENTEDKSLAKKESKAVEENYTQDASNVPMLAMRAAETPDNIKLVEGLSYALVNGSVSALIYSEHSEIEAILNQNETDLLIVSEELAYAKIDGKFYKIEALGLTMDEFSEFISKEF